MTGSHEVIGSIPFSSTNNIKGLDDYLTPFLLSADGSRRPIRVNAILKKTLFLRLDLYTAPCFLVTHFFNDTNNLIKPKQLSGRSTITGAVH
jgi:hypothetical protein